MLIVSSLSHRIIVAYEDQVLVFTPSDCALVQRMNNAHVRLLFKAQQTRLVELHAVAPIGTNSNHCPYNQSDLRGGRKRKTWLQQLFKMISPLEAQKHFRAPDTYNEVDQGKEEEEDNDADGHVSLASPQPCLVKPLFFDGHISSFEVAVVLLVDVASLYCFLSHGLLYGPIGTLLQGKINV